MTDLSIKISAHHNNEPHWGGVAELIKRQIELNFSLNNELVEEFEEAINYCKDLIECALDLFHLIPKDGHYFGVFDEETEDGKFLVGIFELNSDFEETRRICWLEFS